MSGETVTLTLSKEEAKILWNFFASIGPATSDRWPHASHAEGL